MLALLLLLAVTAVGQETGNKFKDDTRPAPLPQVAQEVHAGAQESAGSAALGLRVAWRARLSSASLAGATVADFDNDGRAEILFASSNQFIEVLDAENGERSEGWPFGFPDSQFVAAPLLYDVDRDGALDVVVTTERAEVVFLRHSGQPLFNFTIAVPPLPVDRDWFGDAKMSGDVQHSLWRDKHAPRKFRHTLSRSPDRQGSRFLNEHEGDTAFTEEGLRSFDLFLSTSLPYSYVTQSGLHLDVMMSPTYREPEFDAATQLLIPAHVLATPVIADLDRDGRDELIVPVSYYFDAIERTMDRYNLQDADDSKAYLACGIAVFDLETRELRFTVDLDLSFDDGPHRAYMFASPTVMDVTGDGNLDIVVATGSGRLFVLDHLGEVVDPFPAEMDAIASQVIVEDFDGDGSVEIIAMDRRGHLVCYNPLGQEQWVHHLHKGEDGQAEALQPMDHSPTVGDIDGDGVLDLVIGTAGKLLYALSARTGAMLPGYPVLFPDPIVTEVSMSRKAAGARGQHLWVSAGHRLYVIDGANPRAPMDFLDLGEDAAAAVSLGEFTGNNRLDALVATTHGSVFAVETDLVFHPLQSWSTPWNGGNMLLSRASHGVYVSNREWRDIVGDSFPVRFTIMDATHKGSSYAVSIYINGALFYENTYDSPGSYVARVQALHHRGSGTIVLQVEDERHRIFYDSFTVGFQLGFSRILKWVLALPLAALCGAVLVTSQQRERLEGDALFMRSDKSW